jgi:zinc protease
MTRIDRAPIAYLRPPVTGTPPAPKAPRPLRVSLPNGLRVVAIARRQLPQIAMKLLLPAGSSVEPAEWPGTAGLVGCLLTEGTERWSADELNAQLDRLGASVDVHVGHDFAEVEIVLLSETLEEALPLVAEILTRPTFPRAEVERVRRESLDALDARYDEPANVADDRTAEAVFGPDHPYGRITAGTEDGLRGVPVEVLRGFHHERYRPGGSALICAGDFDPDRLLAVLADALAQWEGSASPGRWPAAPDRAVAAGRQIALPWRDAAQSEIRLGGVGLERSSPDWIPAAVANYILGGSTITGRLGANLREDKGWTYGARSGFSAGLQPGGWVVETAVDAAVAADAVGEIRAEIVRLLEAGPHAEELDRAKEALVLSLPRAFETPSRVVNRFVTLEGYGLELDYWERFPETVRGVGAEDVVRMVGRYMDPDRLVEVVVG